MDREPVTVIPVAAGLFSDDPSAHIKLHPHLSYVRIPVFLLSIKFSQSVALSIFLVD